MFKNNLVMAIKANGKVLREFTGIVYLPFGIEYSIYLKNLSSTKVKVHVSIDGNDALDGKSIIINGNSNLELKRFIKNGNLNSGNSFKFIEKTAAVEKHRGNKAEDGLVTIKYEYEDANWGQRLGGSLQPLPKAVPYKPSIPNTPYPDVWRDSHTPYNMGSMDNDLGTRAGQWAAHLQSSADSSPTAKCPQPINLPATPINTAGVTAPGSVTEQKFSVADYFFGSGIHHVMTLELHGAVSLPTTYSVNIPDTMSMEDANLSIKRITEEVTVDKKKYCSMCGTKVHPMAKFCHECGSSVEIV